MTGKEKCNCLKQLRKTIAELNGIEYHPRECDEEVCNCGTCSLCDQEAEQLLTALRKKEASGSPIRIDVESIEGFGLLAVEPFEYDGPEPLAGVPLQGDIVPDEEDFDSIGHIHPLSPDDLKDR